MLTDLEDDYFYEEDKILTNSENESVCLLQLEQPEVTLCAANLQESEEITADTIVDLEVMNLQAQEELSATIMYATQTVLERYIAYDWQNYELDRLGMTVSTGTVTIKKDQTNLIGISIGGGAPHCPCLYIVQIFDGTPAAREGSLESGDELLAVNSVSVKGKTKVEVAKLIQSTNEQVSVHYNKLHADPAQGKSLDIILKKLKHRLVDSMSSNTADSLGLSRAILCNDSLVKRLDELEGTEIMYEGLVDHAKRMLKAYFVLLQTYKALGDCFTQVSTHEPQQRASEVFRAFGEFHRSLEKDGLAVLKKIKPILNDLRTYLNKAIPDTKLTVRRYMDAKFTYLSYCLKVKEMDDEEHGYAAIQEPLYRVETGNYEYRLILRCRQDARAKFSRLRTDVLEKMELLECKHANDLNKQLRSLLQRLADLNRAIVTRVETLPPLFPIEVDFKETAFQYKSSTLKPQELDDDELDNGAQSDCAATVPVINVSNENQCLLDNLQINSEGETQVVTAADDTDAILKDLGLFDVDLMSKAHKKPNAFDFDLFLNQNTTTTTTTTTKHLQADLMSSNAQQTDLLLQ